MAVALIGTEGSGSGGSEGNALATEMADKNVEQTTTRVVSATQDRRILRVTGNPPLMPVAYLQILTFGHLIGVSLLQIKEICS